MLPVLSKREVCCKIVTEKALVLTGTHEHANGFRDVKILKSLHPTIL